MKAVFVIVWVIAAVLTWVGLGAFVLAGAVLGVLTAAGLAVLYLALVIAKVYAALESGATRAAVRGWEVLCRGL